MRAALLATAALAALLLPATAAPAVEKFVREDRRIAINPTHAVPAEVGPERWVGLAGADAGFWRIPVTGTSARVAGRRDGRQVIGFATDLPPGALGSWDAWFVREFKRRRRCRRLNSGRLSCRRVRVYRHSRVLEADIRIRGTGVRWNPGPRYPTSAEFDLETTLIHEFGHFARPNEPHRFGCANHPLVDALAPGEWWRNQGDWFRRDCPNSPSRPRRAAAKRGEKGRFVVTLHRLPDRVVP
jgi:hypothetical protein